MTSTSLVSIIIPCYNAERYVGDAIRSALGQTYEPVEVIVVDDGSADSSLDVIRTFEDQIVWRTGENQGVSVARNRGIKLANGKYVRFLDADDMLPEDSVQVQVEQMKTESSERISVFGDSHKMDSEGEIIGHSSFRPKQDDESSILYILNVSPSTVHALHHRGSLREVGGFDESLRWAEDYDLHLRLQLSGISLKYHPADVVCVRQHDGESRLTNRKTKEFEETPEAPLRRLRDREQKIRAARPEGLPAAVRQRLAKAAWGSGRQALKAGHPEIAQKYFDYARELHSNPVASSSQMYHWGVRLFGPAVTERAVEWVRRWSE